jgi:hypothetical protein
MMLWIALFIAIDMAGDKTCRDMGMPRNPLPLSWLWWWLFNRKNHDKP